MFPAPLPVFNCEANPKHTESPNPIFTYGQAIIATDGGRKWLEGEKAGWTIVDPSKRYTLMSSGIVPRPIAFVSSISEDGVANLAPFSWFNKVSHTPPLISVSVSKHLDITGDPKDTAANVKKTKQFTVNIISEAFAENANVTALDAPPDVSEWDICGLTKEPSIHVKAPRLKESAFSMECEAVDIIDPDSGVLSATLMIGLVKYIHLRNDVLDERGLVDFARVKPIARLGDISYARVGDAFRLARPE